MTTQIRFFQPLKDITIVASGFPGLNAGVPSSFGSTKHKTDTPPPQNPPTLRAPRRAFSPRDSKHWPKPSVVAFGLHASCRNTLKLIKWYADETDSAMDISLRGVKDHSKAMEKWLSDQFYMSLSPSLGAPRNLDYDRMPRRLPCVQSFRSDVIVPTDAQMRLAAGCRIPHLALLCGALFGISVCMLIVSAILGLEICLTGLSSFQHPARRLASWIGHIACWLLSFRVLTITSISDRNIRYLDLRSSLLVLEKLRQEMKAAFVL